MLLTRSLPPQFLLPAWSARQLLQAQVVVLQQQQQQCVHKSDSTWSSSKRTNPNSNPFRSRNPPSKLNKKPRTAPALSLFEELFPEEREIKLARSETSQEELDKLPTFKWKLEEPWISAETDDGMQRWVSTYRRRPIVGENPKYLGHSGLDMETDRRSEKLELDEGRRRSKASVVVLDGAMKTLEESDFFRLSPKGEHIEGWASGIVKVIPGRDNITLERLGHYFILFSTDAAAWAYRDNSLRLYKLARTRSKWQDTGVPGFPLPPGFLKEGEDIQALIKNFSLAPAQSRIHLRQVNKPYKPSMLRLLDTGGPAAILARKSKSEDMVLLYSEFGNIGYFELVKAINQDGKRRNLHWKLVGGEEGIITLNTSQIPAENVEARTSEGVVERRKHLKSSSRYVLPFADRHEARRFVREWHRRPFPSDLRGSRPAGAGESPPIVNAEILW